MQSSNSRSSSGSSAAAASGAGSRSARQNSARIDVAEDGLRSQRGDMLDGSRHDRIGHAAHVVGGELQVRDRGHGDHTLA